VSNKIKMRKYVGKTVLDTQEKGSLMC